MPVRNTRRALLRDFSLGVKRFIDSAFIDVNLNSKQLLKCENAFWRGGLQKRKGMVKVSTKQVNGTSPVNAIHRFYRRTLTKQFFAASNGSIFQLNEGTGIWTLIKTGLSASNPIYFTTYGPTERVLIADGTNIPLSWDGSVISNYTAAPVGTKEFVIHRGRVFSYTNNVTIAYSDNLAPDTWTAPSISLITNDPFITKMIVHTQNTSETSVIAQLLVFTDNSTWVLAGNDFGGLTDVVLHELSGNIGTLSPNSVIKTPLGVMFLGRQQGRNNVFLVVGEGLGAKIVPVGNNIRRDLENIPASGLGLSTAIYKDGHYRLSIRSIDGLNNKEEWWLDLDRLTSDGTAWFGPMNRSVGMLQLLSLSGSNDDNLLYGAGEDGFVYSLDQTNDDDGVVIPVDIQTGFNDFGFFAQEKRIEDVIILVQSSGGFLDVFINVDFQSTAEEVTKQLSLVSGGDSFPYTFPIRFLSTPPNIETLNFSQSRLEGLYISIRAKHSSLTDSFILSSLGIKYNIDEQDQKEV